jgi:hypothetical protein
LEQLVVAQKRGDVNVIADKKKAVSSSLVSAPPEDRASTWAHSFALCNQLQVAQLRRRDATRRISQLLRRYDSKQAQELDDIITEVRPYCLSSLNRGTNPTGQFASITKEFFHGGAALLRAVESPPHRSSATLRFPRRLTHPVGGRDPVAV